MRSHSRIAWSDIRQKELSFFIRRAAQLSATLSPCIELGLRIVGAGVRKVIVWGRSAHHYAWYAGCPFLFAARLLSEQKEKDAISAVL
jgi:hypothetical protein